MASRGVTRFKTMGGFAGHRAGGGGGGKFLSKWKENGNIEVWFHTKELPIAIVRHQFPMVVIKEDRDDRSKKVKHIWSKNFVCHETEGVFESQYFRDKETGERKTPPERCGACKLVEWCYQQALLFEETRGKKKPQGLSFTTPIFHFEGDVADEEVTLHIGGVCNLFGKDMSDAQKEDMKAAKISAKHAWRENCWAKCQYAMMVVDNAHPEAGVQIAIEASSLGDKVKKVLDTELENEVDIQKHPYCIKWKYNEKETDLNKKYDALAIRKAKPTPRILQLIRGEAPPLPDDLSVPFNQQSLRSVLERHCVLPEGVVPWDELFPSKEQSAAWAKEDAEEARALATSEDDDGESGDEDEDEDAPESDDDDGEEEMFACNNDDCGKPVKASDKKCPHCGEVFEVDDGDDSEPPPPPKKMRSRSEVVVAKAFAPTKGLANGGGSGGTKKGRPDKAVEPVDDDGDDLPFCRDMTFGESGRV